MCGILGAVATGSGPDLSIWSPWIDRGLAAMTRRGPDAGGHFVDGRVALGARRLRVHDLSPSADQPMHSRDGRSVIVFNGAIFNFKPLRAELAALGRTFHTNSDTEVALEALTQWGERAFERFDGMFAIAWYDRASRRLLVGRDKLGIKPLHYTTAANGDLLFASEIKPLLAHPHVARRVNRQALPEFLAFQFVSPPDTLFDGIHVLPPGHFLCFEDGTPAPAPRAYWQLDKTFVDAAVAARLDVADALDISLRRCWDADRPVGIQLSGGVDSSLVVADSYDKLGLRDRVATYSVVFDDSEIEYYKPRSEERFIKQVLDKYPYGNRSFQYSAGEVRPALPEAMWFHEQPLMGASTCLYMLLARSINREVTVLITGEGADDIFLGYFANWQFDRNAATQFQYFVPAETLARLVGQDGVESAVAKRLRILERPGIAECTPTQTASILTIETVLHGLLARHDRMFMSHSIEGRPPFCTDEMLLARFALADADVTDGTNGKLPLKRMAAQIFGHDFAFRTKVGFSAPFGDWCAKSAWWRGYVDRLNLDLLAEFIDPAPVREWQRRPESIEKWSGAPLNMAFALMQFQLWYEMFIAGPDPCVPGAWQRLSL
jgi:asparagine synthase (glutamine-hydrolysing)